MKVSAIPAQITTVEDRIAGNLNLTQLLLLALPLFIVALIFFLCPPAGIYAGYKMILAILISGSSSLLAIRLNGAIVLDHIKLRANYELRPHIYVYSPKVAAATERSIVTNEPAKAISKPAKKPAVELSNPALSGISKLLNSSNYKVIFKRKTGGLIVKVSYLK